MRFFQHTSPLNIIVPSPAIKRKRLLIYYLLFHPQSTEVSELFGEVTLEGSTKIARRNQDIIFIQIIVCIKSMIPIVYPKCPSSSKLVISDLLGLFPTAGPGHKLVYLMFLFLLRCETNSSKEVHRIGAALSLFLTPHFLQQPEVDIFWIETKTKTKTKKTPKNLCKLVANIFTIYTK